MESAREARVREVCDVARWLGATSLRAIVVRAADVHRIKWLVVLRGVLDKVVGLLCADRVRRKHGWLIQEGWTPR